jgi:hypothetical protein
MINETNNNTHLTQKEIDLLEKLVAENTKICKEATESLKVNGVKFIEKIKS